MGYIRAKCPKKGKASSSKQSVQWVEGTASPSMSSVYLEYFNYWDNFSNSAFVQDKMYLKFKL